MGVGNGNLYMCVVIALDFLRALKRSADQVFILT
jgi:hypothetical protein